MDLASSGFRCSMLECVKVTVTKRVQAGDLSFLVQNQSVPAQVVGGVRPEPEPLLHTNSHRCALGRPAPGSSQFLESVPVQGNSVKHRLRGQRGGQRGLTSP